MHLTRELFKFNVTLLNGKKVLLESLIMLLRHTFLMFLVIRYSDLHFLCFYLLVLKSFFLKYLLISVKEIKAENGEVIGLRSESKSVLQPGIGDLF